MQPLVMLAPHITTADVPKQLPPSADISWVAPIVQRCATAQMSHVSLGMLTPQEARIRAAVENTLHEICRLLALVWVEFVGVEEANEVEATEAIKIVHGHIGEMMEWPDWSVWIRCSLGELCYIPSWPYMEDEDLYDLTPRCLLSEDIVSVKYYTLEIDGLQYLDYLHTVWKTAAQRR